MEDGQMEVGQPAAEPIDPPWRIGVVENEATYRLFVQEHLAEMPDIASLTFWNSAEEYWRDPASSQIDLLLLDILLPHMSGVDLMRLISERDPGFRVVMLTGVYAEDMVFAALKNGAVGYVLKTEERDIHRTIRVVMQGGAMITPTIAFRVLMKFQNRPGTPGDPELTVRERQVLEELISGKRVRAVASTLGVSVDTIKFHVRNIYRKLNVSNKVDLMRKVTELGWL